ncbi:MAG: exo-alpha-sialidase [Deltaproteobacteria bacterium]|nr:exo-alpha-sialidase [Deltaproteobacteria bacterium]
MARFLPASLVLATPFLLMLGCSSSSDSPPASTPSDQDAAAQEGGNDDVTTEDAPVEAPAPTKATFVSEQSITIASTTTDHLAFPDVTRLKDGRILLVYRQGASHVDATGRIMKQFGTADGLTWTQPEVLYDEKDIDDRDPSVTTLSNGDVLVDYFQYKVMKLADGDMSVHHIFVGRSSDDAATFGPFTQVNPGSMSPSNPKLSSTGRWVDDTNQELMVQACSSAVLEVGGELILPAYGGNPLNLKDLAHCPKSTITMYTSTDGVKWAEKPLTFDLLNTWLQEPALLRLANGTTLMQVRTAKGASPSNPGKMMQATSTDDAKTFSALTSFPFVGHAPELAQMKSGLVLSGYRQLDDAYTQEWVSFSWSLDDGKTWSEPVQVEDCGAQECGYPSILELDSQRFLFVYYAPGGAAIQAVVYKYTLE